MITFTFDLSLLSFEQIFLSLQNQDHFVCLDGHDPSHPHSEYAIIGVNPVKVYNSTNINFDEIKNDSEKYKPENFNDFDTPISSGLIGFLSYEFGYHLNHLKNPFEENSSIPLFQFGLYHKIITINHKTNQITLYITSTSESEANKEYNNILSLIKNAPIQKNNPVILSPKIDKNSYKTKINQTIEYIKNGDIFQANIAQFFSTKTPESFDTASLFLKARKQNPSPYSSYIRNKDFDILSSSPECFLFLKDGYLKTFPIKGTIPDTQNKILLEQSQKDRAENIMIVDLMRNDFSKICTDQSIHVEKLCAIETFKGLHHMVSTISGKLQDNKTIFDAIISCFPGGSITGAPKRRAMEIIAELEQKPRNIFCGSIGYIADHGEAKFNIAIRTLLVTKTDISLWAGGGITSLSDPEDEYDETLTKAQKWREVLSS